MKKTLCAIGALCLLAAVSVSAQSLKTPKLKNDIDSVSFYLGVDIGTTLSNMGIEFNTEIFTDGVMEGLRLGRDFDKSDFHAYLQEYFNVRIPAKKLVEAEAYLETVARQPNIRRSESGLLYQIIKQGDMSHRAVDENDSVEVTYIGSFTDGTVFDENDEGIIFQLNRVIPGWTEGLKLIGKGGRIKLYVHPDLGYGVRGGGGGRIPANSVLIFDVTVLDAPEI